MVYTHPRREQVAAENLINQGFDAYLPLYKNFRDAAVVQEPMFPRYVFFRPCAPAQSIAHAKSTRGVSFVLGGTEGPSVMGDRELQGIRECELLRNTMETQALSPFQPGSDVRLKGCGLRGLVGLVHAVSSTRVTLLLEIMGQSRAVHVTHHQLERA